MKLRELDEAYELASKLDDLSEKELAIRELPEGTRIEISIPLGEVDTLSASDSKKFLALSREQILDLIYDNMNHILQELKTLGVET